MATRRFPIVLTLFAAVAFAILCGLGTWQYQRMQWKRDLLARIEAAKTAPVIPIADALGRASRGEDVEWTRVEAVCAPPAAGDRQGLLYALDDGEIAWRALALCRLPGAVYGSVVVDRGFSTKDRQAISPTSVDFAPPVRVRGVLRNTGPRWDAPRVEYEFAPIGDDARISERASINALIPLDQDAVTPVHLVAESEAPPPEGVTPAALPTNISNRHLEYVITWFGLAGALAAVYGAMLWRRLRQP